MKHLRQLIDSIFGSDDTDIRDTITFKLSTALSKHDIFWIIGTEVSRYFNSQHAHIFLIEHEGPVLKKIQKLTQINRVEPVLIDAPHFELFSEKRIYRMAELSVDFRSTLSSWFLSDNAVALPVFSVADQLEGVVMVEPSPKRLPITQKERDVGRFILYQTAIMLDRCRPYDEIKKDRQAAFDLSQKTQSQASIALLGQKITDEITPLLLQLQNHTTLLPQIKDPSAMNQWVKTTLSLTTRFKDMTRTIAQYAQIDLSKHMLLDPLTILESVLQALPPHTLTVQKALSKVPNVWTDSALLHQSFMNILTNTITHTPSGGDITLTSMPAKYTDIHNHSKEGVLIQIQDSGSGIKADDLERVTDPFFTTHSTGNGHMGLGLSLAFQFICTSGGYLSVDSKEGIGTTVNIYLPTQSQI